MPDEAGLRWHINRWQGTDGKKFVAMSNETLEAYVCAWLNVRCIDEATSQQRAIALAHCKALSYWDGCVDPDVQIVRSTRTLE